MTHFIEKCPSCNERVAECACDNADIKQARWGRMCKDCAEKHGWATKDLVRVDCDAESEERPTTPDDVDTAATELRKILLKERGMRDRVLHEPRRTKALAEIDLVALPALRVLMDAAGAKQVEQGELKL